MESVTYTVASMSESDEASESLHSVLAFFGVVYLPFCTITKAWTYTTAMHQGSHVVPPDTNGPCLLLFLLQKNLVCGRFFCRASLSQPCVSA